MSAATYRVAGPEHADLLTDLERSATTAALVHIFGAERPYPVDDVRARWTIVLDDPRATTLLAYDGDEPVGYATVDPPELRHFGVAPDRFGSGTADALLAEALARMAAAGADLARLWVLEENRRARRFYERHGWLPDGRAGQSEFPPYPTQLGYTLLPLPDRR